MDESTFDEDLELEDDISGSKSKEICVYAAQTSKDNGTQGNKRVGDNRHSSVHLCSLSKLVDLSKTYPNF